MIRLGAFVVNLVLLTVSDGAVGSEDHSDDIATRAQQTALKLSELSDADSLATAGLLLSTGTPAPAVMSLFDRAVAGTPDRPDLLWLQSQVCASLPACDPEPIEQQLRTLAPSNAAGWMGALTRASLANDPVARDVALEAIGKSEHLNIYFTTLVARLTRAAVRPGLLTLAEAEIHIIGMVAAHAIPAYSAASNGCKEERLNSPANIETCRGVAKSFQTGDTYITEMIGVAIAKRVWPEDSPEWLAAVEGRRRYEAASNEFLKLDFYAPAGAERYLELCERNAREQDVFMAAIRDGLH